MWKEDFSELGAHFLFFRNLGVSNISRELLRSVVSQYYMALVWFDVVTVQEQSVGTERYSNGGSSDVKGPDGAFGIKYFGRRIKQALETLASSFRYRIGGMPEGAFQH